MLQFLNVLFFVFHTLWMLFNCVGWIWRRTRPWQLGTVLLTALSWFVLGYWFNWGYCLCTDWHWRVRDQLGYPRDHSYTHLLVLQLTGLDLPVRVIDGITLGVFAVVALLGVLLNVRDFRRRRMAQRPAQASVSRPTPEPAALWP